jgi:hypothetical protein
MIGLEETVVAEKQGEGVVPFALLFFVPALESQANRTR